MDMDYQNWLSSTRTEDNRTLDDLNKERKAKNTSRFEGTGSRTKPMQLELIFIRKFGRQTQQQRMDNQSTQ